VKIEKDMRCVLVSSRVTFVPGNYDEFILGLLRNSQVVGFVELN